MFKQVFEQASNSEQMSSTASDVSIEALRKRKDQIRFIQVRHEEATAFMACAYAKSTVKQRWQFAGTLLIEAVVDPSELPMPPNVTMKQAGHLPESPIQGEPNRKKIAVTVADDKIRAMV
jgi:thiamine pyrophosphate-dependent acetolactate synthase large subunit-like protein